MDWALVLASQGIEPVIQTDADGKWLLLIPASLRERAESSIRLFRIENRHWHWRRQVFRQRVVFDWVAGLWVLVIVLFHWVSARHPEVTEAGVLRSDALVSGQWWRLFTATWLHADISHLAGNAGFGFLLLALALGRHGTGAGLLAALLAGAAGNVASVLVHGTFHQGLGASGVVMGALGLLATQTRQFLRPGTSRTRVVLTTFAAAVLLFVLLGFSPQSDVVAHCGGFLAGLVLSWLLGRMPDLAGNIPLNLAAGLVSLGVIVIPWSHALQRPS